MIFARQTYIDDSNGEMRTIDEFTEVRDGFAVGERRFYAVLDVTLGTKDGKGSAVRLHALRVRIEAETIAEAFQRFDAGVEANIGAAIAHELNERQRKPREYGTWTGNEGKQA